ncbi:MAG: hypothetical protein N4A43_03905 [Alphaproteobacteria bacterium]|nr:hypothetical protein [Alphaproteobacteria bacterium]
MKQIKYLIEAFFVYILLFIFKLLPVDIASATGSVVARCFLRFSKWDSIARSNINKVYPDISNKEVDTIIKGMWNNIGRIAGEYVHLDKIIESSGANNASKRVNLKGVENVEALLNDGKACLFVSGHIGNWEIIRAFKKQFGKDMGCVYRTPNNPYVSKMLNKMRKDEKYVLYPKSVDGMRAMTKDVKKGMAIGILVDQWLSDASNVVFLGQHTSAPDMYAKFAKKYGAHIIPLRFNRVNGKCKFEIIFDKEIQVSKEDKNEDIAQKVNDKLTEYIKQEPKNWLWIHNRFK